MQGQSIIAKVNQKKSRQKQNSFFVEFFSDKQTSTLSLTLQRGRATDNVWSALRKKVPLSVDDIIFKKSIVKVKFSKNGFLNFLFVL